jgi:hypothetical protein
MSRTLTSFIVERINSQKRTAGLRVPWMRQNQLMTHSTAKRHHYVPAFYLRGFADGDRITTVRLPGDQRYTNSVRRTAAENGFYAVPNHPDGADSFEKSLSHVEGRAAGIFASIEAGEWPLASRDRADLAYFIALQAIRGPEQRRNMDLVGAAMTRLEVGHVGKANVKAWAKRQYGADLTDAEAEKLWEEAVQPGGPPIRHTALAHIEQILELVDAIHPSMSFRPWTLVRFEDQSLITSDTPVVLVAGPADRLNTGVGFMTAQNVFYPLTRKLGLIMGDPQVMIDLGVHVARVRNGEFDLSMAGSHDVVELFNDCVAWRSSIALFHHPEDASSVPDKLPQPHPATMQLSGGEHEFMGESFFDLSGE